MNKPRLSICVVTYNHEKYIAGALESFLRQKTNFAFQVIVGDDASTDSTPQILREYAEKYPDIIKPILREKNISPIKNSVDVYSRAKTEFVALCDGDDYWRDDQKLQMQVDYLDAHPETAISYHTTRIHYEDGSRDDIEYPSPSKRFNKTILTLDDLAVCNPMHTCSIVYRWRFQSEDIRKFMPDDICPGDYFLSLLHAETGNIAFIDRVMSVYRVHPGGMSFGIHKQRHDLVWLKYGLEELNFHRAVDSHFNSRLYRYFHLSIERKAFAVLNAYLRHGEFEKLAIYKKVHPDYYALAIDCANHAERLQSRLLELQLHNKIKFGLIDYWRMFKKRGLRLPFYYFFNAHLFDLLHKTDTHQWLPKDQYLSLPDNFEYGAYYMASWTKEISRAFQVLKNLIPDFETFAFLDVGCGKGKVVIVWQQLLNKGGLNQKTCGIDYYRPFIEIANANYEKVFSKRGSFIHSDAAKFDYDSYGEKLIIYLYNPFDKVMLGTVLEQLRNKEIYIIYNNPAHASIMPQFGFKEIYKKMGFHHNADTTIFVKRRADVSPPPITEQ